MLLDRVAMNGLQLDEIAHDLRRLSIDKPLRVQVSQHTSRRSAQQNRRYWGYVLTTIRDWIYEHSGQSYAAETLHEFFKQHFQPVTVVQVGTDQRIIPQSTTALSVEEFGEFVEKVVAYAVTELGVEFTDDQ